MLILVNNYFVSLSIICLFYCKNYVLLGSEQLLVFSW